MQDNPKYLVMTFDKSASPQTRDSAIESIKSLQGVAEVKQGLNPKHFADGTIYGASIVGFSAAAGYEIRLQENTDFDAFISQAKNLNGIGNIKLPPKGIMPGAYK